MITFSDAIKLFFTRYTDFSGRSTRAEYWWATLFNDIVFFVLYILSMINPMCSILFGIYALAIIIPGFAIQIRRLHDTGKSGWCWCVVFIPIIGDIILLVFNCEPSVPNTGHDY